LIHNSNSSAAQITADVKKILYTDFSYRLTKFLP
jgi:hypothetical protein